MWCFKFLGAPRRISSTRCVCGAIVTITLCFTCVIYLLSNPALLRNLIGFKSCDTQRIKKTRLKPCLFYSGAPRRIRTLNLLIRSQMLYPIEPWAQCFVFYIILFELQEKIKNFYKNILFLSCGKLANSIKFNYKLRNGDFSR